MRAILVSSDLMTWSQFQGAAAALGIEAALTQTLPALEEQLTLGSVGLVAVDLATAPTTASVVPTIRQGSPNASIVAFGPHVHEGLLADAAAAGCDAVLARGQFLAQASAILRRYCVAAV